MKNVANTEAYSAFDHIFLKALRSISHVVSVKKITRPFWGRWRASGIDEKVLFDFLSSIRNIDDWPDAALRMIAKEGQDFALAQQSMSATEKIAALRRLSYLCNLGQWGILPINEAKKTAYRGARDYYLQAESLAYGERFMRLQLIWKGVAYYGTLHRPDNKTVSPLVIVVHGLDDCKEEHLSTELALLDAGFTVLGFDGPGQGEAFLLDGHLWTADFHALLSAWMDQLSHDPLIDVNRTGSIGFSIGSMWSLLAAARDPRISAVYDLGAPINTKAFTRVPFLIKSKMCQITGAKTQDEIDQVLAQNYIDTPEILGGLRASVRIIHGLRDRIVATQDKVWLMDELLRIGNAQDVSMKTFEDGDHCCTNHLPEIRRDMTDFFIAHLHPGGIQPPQ
jgi:pimeloyl-ACP methyl ester carboxylesterase